MDIRVLRYFLAVAKEGNITKAAEVLHITQPTLSRQIMELEEKLGTILFTRGKRQVTLTPQGILFQQRAREIIALVEKTERDMSESMDVVNGTVGIGCVETMASQLLPELIGEFSRTWPMVTYQLYSADGDDIREKLDRGNIDIGILLEPVEAAKYNYVRLPCYERWGVVLRRSDPLARKKGVSASDLAHRPLIVPRRTIVREELVKWLNIPAEEVNILAGHNLLSNSLPLVQAGLANVIGVSGAFGVQKPDDLCFVPFTPEWTTGHVLAWRKNQLYNRATSLFLEAVKHKYKE